MKNQVVYIIIAIFCFSCGNIETPIEQNNDTSTVSEINEDNSLEKTADVPPVWLKEIIQEKTEKIQAKQDGMGRYRIKKYHQINNSLSYAITNAFIDGVCDRDTLATYMDGKKIDQISVLYACDADQVAPEYEWTEYDSITARSFRIRAYREYAIDASLIGSDGFLKDHILDEVETKIDSTITIVKIEDNGKITEQK